MRTNGYHDGRRREIRRRGIAPREAASADTGLRIAAALVFGSMPNPADLRPDLPDLPAELRADLPLSALPVAAIRPDDWPALAQIERERHGGTLDTWRDVAGAVATFPWDIGLPSRAVTAADVAAILAHHGFAPDAPLPAVGLSGRGRP